MYFRVERIIRQPNGTAVPEFFNSFRSLKDLLSTMPSRRVDHDGNPINPTVSYVFYDALTDEVIEDPRPIVTDDTPRLCSPGPVDPVRQGQILDDIEVAVHHQRTRKRRQTVGQAALF
ncbi:hypothetical protein IT415_04030 [bacterium]|nr:hypothetical protein [bacterium]